MTSYSISIESCAFYFGNFGVVVYFFMSLTPMLYSHVKALFNGEGKLYTPKQPCYFVFCLNKTGGVNGRA